jgi:hypothetical protein
MPERKLSWQSVLMMAVLVMVVLVLAGGWSAVSAQSFELTRSPLPQQAQRAEPPLPAYPVQLVVDDDQPESAFGVNATTSLQFLWFNHFTDPGPFTLEEIWVLFPPGSNMVVGAQVELVVFQDPDGDPSNGAVLLAAYDQTIQVLDGNTFSVYPVSLAITDPGDIYIGAINRFTDPAATPPLTEPAMADTSTGQNRSWWALWSGPVPDPPVLPPDLALERLEGNTEGNWMIRGFGTALQPQQTAIPVLGWVGTLVLAAFLAAFGLYLVRRIGT